MFKRCIVIWCDWLRGVSLIQNRYLNARDSFSIIVEQFPHWDHLRILVYINMIAIGFTYTGSCIKSPCVFQASQCLSSSSSQSLIYAGLVPCFLFSHSPNLVGLSYRMKFQPVQHEVLPLGSPGPSCLSTIVSALWCWCVRDASWSQPTSAYALGDQSHLS